MLITMMMTMMGMMMMVKRMMTIMTMIDFDFDSNYEDGNLKSERVFIEPAVNADIAHLDTLSNRWQNISNIQMYRYGRKSRKKREISEKYERRRRGEQWKVRSRPINVKEN